MDLHLGKVLAWLNPVISPQFVMIKNTVMVYHDAEETHTLAPDECPHI